MRRLLLPILFFAACASPPPAPPAEAPTATAPSTPPRPSPPASASTTAAAPDAPIETPTKALTFPEARRYMLTLINRDRKTENLPPVKLEEGPAQAAGQAHAEDMVRLGYLGHWGSDGSVPEERHTAAGGVDMVLENALCFTDEHKRKVDGKALIDPKQVERAESLFFNEVPPNDGHRKNILKPQHTHVGIGVAQSTETERELAVPCFSQEFIDVHGTYVPVPRHAKPGTKLHVEATMDADIHPTGVGLARIPLPKPIPPSELNKRRSYPVPKPYQMYWGPGFVTPITAKINGQNIAIDVPLGREAGLYEVSVWGKIGKSDEQAMLGLRTMIVD